MWAASVSSAWVLTIHSTRCRFAARVNSGVSMLTKIIVVVTLSIAIFLAGCHSAERLEKPSGSAATNLDSDQDLIPDSRDQCPGSSVRQPIGPNGCPVINHPGLYHNWVNFDSGSSELRPDAIAILSEWVNHLQRNPFKFELIGHTDSCSSAEANNELSVMRATAVRNHLLSLGLPSGLVVAARGQGSSRLLEPRAIDATCSSETNRRVELVDAK